MSMKRLALALFLILLTVTTSSAATIFQDNMESGPGSWTATGLWHLATGADPCPNAKSGTASWYYGNASCTYDTGATNSGTLTSQTIAIPTLLVGEKAELTFQYWYQTEGDPYYDAATVEISNDNGATFAPQFNVFGTTMSTWLGGTVDLSSYAGQNILIRFHFDTHDNLYNNYRGWYIDDVKVATVALPPFAAYIRGASKPWGQSTNETAMTTVFGPVGGNWNSLLMSGGNAPFLPGSPYTFIFLEGSDSTANELNNYLIANRTVIEDFVNRGGTLLLNSAPNQGGNINFGFGGVTLIYPDYANIVVAADANHPVFLGPYGATGTTFTGNSFAHAYVTGTGITESFCTFHTTLFPPSYNMWLLPV
ncbi:MAG: hypothetical protein M0042_13005 [Nitrospiraceae bacterium]|nr:hypothetical protein [Nitrospiraceae bacterium]